MKENQKNNKFVEHFKKYRVPYLIGTGFVVWTVTLILIGTLRGYDPIAINVFGGIAWYAIFILSGIGMAAILTYRESQFIGIEKDHITDALLFGVILSIIGARLYYVIFFDVGGFKEIFNIRGGGLAIHGVILTVVIFVPIFAKIKKMDLWAFTDLLAIGLLIGQIIGRWGNFFNQEAHGGPISPEAYNVLSKIIPNFIMTNMKIDGVFYHPTFLYESLWNLVGIIALLILRRKRIFKVGDMFGLYLTWYGIGRGFLIEPFRTDPLQFVQGADPANFFLNMLNRVNVVFSLTFLAIGGIVLIIVKNKLKPEIPYYYDVVKENALRIEQEALKNNETSKKDKKKDNK